MSQKLKDKIILITGSSRGIGASVAKEFIREGAKVILSARNTEGLEKIDDFAKENGGEAIIATLDLTQLDKIPDFANQIFARFGKLDGLVLNAASLGIVGPLTHNSLDEFRKVFEVNLSANFMFLKHFEPLLMQAGHGKIIGVSDVLVDEKPAFFAPYIASKLAFENMLKIYAKEVMNLGLQVNIIKLPPIATDLRKSYMPGEVISNLIGPGGSYSDFHLSRE